MSKTTTTKTSTIVQTCIIKATTWNESAQNHSDDDNSRKLEQEFEISSSTNISRTSIGVTMGANTDANDDTHYNLFNLSQENGVFSISRNLEEESDAKTKAENLWMMFTASNAEECESQEHILHEGDVLKLGKIKLRVRELKGLPEPVQQSSDVNNINQEVIKKELSQEFLKRIQINECLNDTELICRICLESDQDQENPLISPCSCAGTVSHIHLDCLRHWIKTKCRVNVTSGCTVYIWKDLDCELCHKSFPDLFAQGEDMSELVDLIKPTKTYMILETMPEMKKFKKIYYVAYMSERRLDKTFTIGRKIECQININDPSVSRLHSTVKYSDGQFILKNRSTTYGTLVLLKDKVQIKKDQKLSIKIGKSILSFDIVDKELFLSQEMNEALAAGDNLSILPNTEKTETHEEEKKYDYHSLRKESLLNTANLSFDFIQNSSFSGLLPVTTDLLDQPDEERPEQQNVHNNFEESKIKDDLENLDRLTNKIKKMLEECYKTLEDSDKKTQNLYGAIVDLQPPLPITTTTTTTTLYQDDTLVL